jgi:hypothetical protein
MFAFVKALVRNLFSVVEQNNILYILRQRCAIEVCVKLVKAVKRH